MSKAAPPMRPGSNLRRLVHLVGVPILAALAASALFGAMVGAAELLFAIALNHFLGSHGLVAATGIPAWLGAFARSPEWFLLTAMTLRFCLMLGSSVLSNLCNELMNRRGRGLVVQATLGSPVEVAGLSAAETSNIVGNLLPRVALFLSSTSQLFNQMVVGGLLLASMLLASPGMSLVGIAGLAVVGVPTLLLRKSYQAYSSGYHGMSARFIERLLKGVRNAYYLRLAGSHRSESDGLRQSARSMSRYAMQYVVRSQLAGSLPGFGGALIFVGLVVWRDELPAAASAGFLGFLYIFYRFSATVGNIILTVGQIEFSTPFVRQFLGFGDRLLAVPHGPAGTAPLPAGGLALSVDGLVVGREGAILPPLTFSVQPGNAVVIAGPSGRGKTTLIMTLLGLVPPLGGKVAWGGVPVEGLDPETFRRAIGYSGADPYLVDGTVLENLRFGLPEGAAEPSAIRAALAAAQCGFIDAMDGGLEARLHEGGQGMSAGERQRLSIARALLRQPRIIVFDEATANVDEAAEAAILAAVRATHPQAVILMVSHRQSLRRFADRVIEI